MMTSADSRAERTARILERDGYDAMICRLPQNVLMLTGYLPILGNSFCVVSRRDTDDPVEIRLAVPEDERDLVPSDVAIEVQTYAEETLERIGTTLPAIAPVLADLLSDAGLDRATIGYEGAPTPVAPAYTQLGVPSAETLHLLQELLPNADLRNAAPTLAKLIALKTEAEIACIRRSIDVAHAGFTAARGAIQVGATEADVEATTLAALVQAGYRERGVTRILPHVHVMSGARAASAYRAFNLTSSKVIERGDTVLVQMEVGIDGYWAELTRTFFAGDVSDFWSRAHEECVKAQDAALEMIRDRVCARDVDRAARQALQSAGLGEAFKHGLGHGIGFQAINHAALPKLHPVSQDVLQTGMVHNLEPAVYVDGQGGIRLNDNVAVRRESAQLLSSGIPRTLDWLVTS